MRLAEAFAAVSLACSLAACGTGSNRDTSNPDWAQAGSPPPPKVTSQSEEWKETEVPAPPSFNADRLVYVEMPSYMSVRIGVDPATIAISDDGVVRYVVVAASRSGGGSNAFYEGIRCASEEVKQYARYSAGTWQSVPQAEWKRIEALNSRYAKALAAQGLCRGHAPRSSVREMLLEFKNPLRELP